MNAKEIMSELSEKMDKPKLCKDCKHLRTSLFDKLMLTGIRFAMCNRAARHFYSTEELVTGKIEETFATVERTDFGSLDTCGREGKYWEPKR